MLTKFDTLIDVSFITLIKNSLVALLEALLESFPLDLGISVFS